jgi:exosortase
MNRMDKHEGGFFVLVAFSLLIGLRPLVETFLLSWKNDEYTYILLILPISLVLISGQRDTVWRTKKWAFSKGSVLLAAATATAYSARMSKLSSTHDVELAIEMAALVLSWNGAFLFFLGAKAYRAAMFPLLFLFTMVPLPKVVLGYCIEFLQQGSAWSAHLLLAIFGVPVVQHGILLTIPDLTIKVAQECSSIRSSSMLVVTTMVIAHVLLHSSWRKAVAIGLAVPLSVAKNGLRIFTIAMLGTKVDPGYLTGRLHHQGGVLFFAIALIAEFVIIRILRRGDLPSFAPDLSQQPDPFATN